MTDKEAGKDFHKLLKSSGLTGTGRLVDILVRYSTSVALTRILGADVFGIFVLARTLITVLSTISGLGMGYGLVRQISYDMAKKNEQNIQQTIRIALIFPGIVSIMTAVLLFIGRESVALEFFRKPALGLPLTLLVYSIPIITLSQILQEALRGFKKITPRVAVEYYLLPCINLMLVLLLYLLGYRLEGAIIAFMASQFISLLFLVLLIRKSITFKGPGTFITKKNLVRFFKFSLPLTFINIFSVLKLRIDILFLGLLSTAANTSIFFIGLRLATFIAIPWQAAHMFFAPMVSTYYAQDQVEKIEYNYKNITKMMFVISMFLWGFILTFSKDLLSIFGPEFKKGALVVSLICFGQLAKTLVGHAGPMLVMIGKSSLNMLIMIITLIFLSILNLLLIPKMGIIGAGIANMTTVMVTSLLELIFIHHYLHIHPFRKDFFKPVIAAVVAIGVTLVLKMILSHAVVFTIMLMMVFGLLYAAVMILLVLSEEEKALVIKMKRKIRFGCK